MNVNVGPAMLMVRVGAGFGGIIAVGLFLLVVQLISGVRSFPL
jgi:hypothetical protein